MAAARPVVFLAYYYPPLGGMGTQRVLGFVRHLPALGFEPVVVAPERGAYGVDPLLESPVEVVRAPAFEPTVAARRLFRRGGTAAGGMVDEVPRGPLSALARRAVHAALYFPDHARGWIRPAARAAIREGRRRGAVAVVSSSPPVSAHVAALRAARALGVPAVLDFRDLFTAHHPEGRRDLRAEAERRLERRLLRGAAAVTTVSEGCRRFLVERHGPAGAKPFVVLRNGHEEEDFSGPAPARERGVFRIVHAGTLYGARQDLSALFRALARVRREGGLAGLRPEVRLAGKVDPQALEAARAAGCLDLVEAVGFVPHAEAVGLMRSATVNLLVTWTEPGPVLDGVCPGKTGELLASGRPVLALVPRGAEAERLLRWAGGARVVDPLDEDGIADALRDLAAAERAGDAATAVPPPGPPASRPSRRSVAGELAGLLASLAS